MLTLNDGRKELYQWDTGRTATVDIECDVVHFANLKYGESLAVEVKGGEVSVPNKLLMSGEPVYCWAFVKDENGAYTKKEQTFVVTKRAKPSDYVYTETEVISIERVVNDALEKAKESGEFKGDKGDKGDKGEKGDQAEIVQTVGNSETAVMSQKATTAEINALKGDISKKITAPATISIGQTICVKAVDETGKPTEWEAADINVDSYTKSEIDTIMGRYITDIDSLLGGDS